MKEILHKSIPILTTYSTLGNITSILNEEVNYYSWLYNNFIQLSSGRLFRFAYQKKMYYDCPFIKRFSIPEFLIQDIVGFIITCIKNNLYLFFLVDRFYISNYSEFHYKHLIHEIFIYGYDDENKFFYTSDNSDHSKYANKKVKFSDLINAYLAVDSNFMHLTKVIHANEPLIDLKLIKASLKDYIFSHRDYYDIGYKETNEYGVNVYNRFINMFKEKDISWEDFRPLHLFWEHKDLMLKRILYLEDINAIECDNSLISDYKKIVRQFMIFRNLQIRYTICKDRDLINQISIQLPYWIDNEILVLKKIFSL